jgi:ferrous iron transport protein B
MGTAGLPGKSFLPMLVGFGCSVPAVYATRTLENPRDRTLTTLLVPFMSCSARLPVYVLFAAAFFPHHAGTIVFSMYLLGVVVALAIGLILRRTLLPEEGGLPAILEMPPYRRPTLRSIRMHTWDRTRAFLTDAGSIILVTSCVVWLLLSVPVGGRAGFGETAVGDSAFGAAARVAAPMLTPLGFGTDEATGALISGFVAKEVVVSTMSQVYGTAPERADKAQPSVTEDLRELATGLTGAVIDTVRTLPVLVGIDSAAPASDTGAERLTDRIRTEFDKSSGGHGRLAGLAFMVFVLLYTPCVAAVAAERRELGAGWMWLSIGGQTALAWLAGLAVFQVGRVLGW